MYNISISIYKGGDKMCLLFCTSCKNRSKESCSNCKTFPLMGKNLNLLNEACNTVREIISDPKNHFPTTETLSSSKGPLYPLE